MIIAAIAPPVVSSLSFFERIKKIAEKRINIEVGFSMCDAAILQFFETKVLFRIIFLIDKEQKSLKEIKDRSVIAFRLYQMDGSINIDFVPTISQFVPALFGFCRYWSSAV